MKLTPIRANMNVVDLGDGKLEVLFSYKTPVACFVPGDGYFRTEKFWSVTTSRHINQWIGDAPVTVRPQEYFDHLIS
jgi:hypothetical protein